MAERRMFAKTIIDSDAFLEMPATSQLLYFHLSMRADDEGFINKPKSIMKMVGAKDDDMNVLIARKFVIPFESGVVVIKHWKIHNYIQKDRFIETKYKDERAMLELDENNSYRMPVSNLDTKCIQNVSSLDTQVSIGKVSIGKDNKTIGRFIPPSVEEVQAYCDERDNHINANEFVDFYSSKGWMIGKNKMKDWKAAVRTWESKRKQVHQSDIEMGGIEDKEMSFDDIQEALFGGS